MKRALQTLMIAAAMLSSSCAFAFATDRYQVEAIIFAHVQKQDLNQAAWQDSQPQLAASSRNQVVLINNGQGLKATSRAYQLLPANQLRLTKFAQRIANADGYNVLNHFAWIQNFATGRMNLQIQDMVPGQTDMLTGNINIARQHYFQTKYNFILTHLQTNDFTGNSTTKYFAMQQSRRMRSNELNYIDSPYLGILIKIYPLANIKDKTKA